ncbi:MAG: hypothetical protein IJB44_04075 [Clostridia bacterium]|nr:hypothetical protein [Clostridia bacterium]
MKKRIAVALVALVMIVGCVVGGTLAWLSAKSNTVTNTFTYGDIEINLWETDLENNKTETGVAYSNIVPGATVPKDPTITVIENSENCYVYAKVTNNVVLDGKTVVTCNIDGDNWTLIGSKTNDNGSVINLYKYNNIVTKSTSNTDLPSVFSDITFSGEIESDDIATLDAIENDIIIEAYAHQSDNIGEEKIANDAAIAWAGVTATASN